MQHAPEDAHAHCGRAPAPWALPPGLVHSRAGVDDVPVLRVKDTTFRYHRDREGATNKTKQYANPSVRAEPSTGSQRDGKTNHGSAGPSRGQAASLYEGGESRRADGSLLRSNTFLGLRAARACARELEALPLHSTLF